MAEQFESKTKHTLADGNTVQFWTKEVVTIPLCACISTAKLPVAQLHPHHNMHFRTVSDHRQDHNNMVQMGKHRLMLIQKSNKPSLTSILCLG